MHRVTVLLNRQQLELLDRTVARVGVNDRAALLKLALREHARRMQAAPAAKPEPRQ